MRNCSLQAISPFPTMFFLRLVLQTHKNKGLFGKGLMPYCAALNQAEKNKQQTHDAECSSDSHMI